MGEIIGLDYAAVIETLKLYSEGKQMFEDILLIYQIEQEFTKA